jgi:restriction endonuclease S subunit
VTVGLKTFEECIEKVSYGNKIQRSDYLTKGNFPVVSQESSLINGYWNQETDVVWVNKPVIVFGDHTRVLKYIDFNFVLGADGTKIIKPKEFIDSKFFYYFLQANPIETKGYARHYRFLKELSLYVPPLATQKAIVAKLDAIFAELDKATAAAEANAKNAEALFQSYLTQVFNRNDENSISTFLGDYYDVRDGTHDSPKFFDKGYPLITSKNLRSGVIDFSNVQYISEEDYLSISQRSGVKKGDVLMAMIGTIGNPVIVDTDVKFSIKNVALFKTSQIQSPEYLRYYLSSDFVVKKMEKDAKGATQKFVGLGYLRLFPIKIPKYEQQLNVVNDLEKHERYTQKLLNAYNNKVSECVSLKNSILRQAFSGDLVKE